MPSWLPLDPGPLPQSDILMRDIGLIAAPTAEAVEGAIAAGKGPCDELIRQVTALRTKKIDCTKAETAVAAARAALASAERDINLEQRRREALRANARELVSQYQQANAASNAAAAKVEAAQAALDSARQAVLNAFLNHTGLNPEGISLTPPAGMNVVQPGALNGRQTPYAQALPLGGGLTIYYVDDGGLWNAGNSRLGASRLGHMFAREIENGQALLAAVAASQAALEEAKLKAQAAEAQAAGLAELAAEADAAAHGLAPLDDQPRSAAQERLEAALTALEDCRRRAAQLANTLADAERALAECEKLAASQIEINKARKRIEEAQRAIEQAEATVEEAEKMRAAAGGTNAADRTRAQLYGGDADKALQDAKEALDEAQEWLADGRDPDGASTLAGAAQGAAARAQEAAEQSEKIAKEGVQKQIEEAERTARQAEMFFQWLKDQGVSPEKEKQIDQILADLARARRALETGDPYDIDLMQQYLDRLADALGAVGFARLHGVTASAASAGISAFAGILYAILESELNAAARRVGNDAFMTGVGAESLTGWIARANSLGLKWQDNILVIGVDVTGTSESYFIIRDGDRYQVIRSSATGGIEFLGEKVVS
ncbi:MAG: hypothetical protein DHS20C05_02460 [Hyphococcus sp.]|nr:MAG: hypothetical protein DHS20C05_02460 [Marinicaulis sp.]